MNDQKNMILAIVLSAIVLFAWQFFIGMPQMEKQRQQAQQEQPQKQLPDTQTTPAPGTTPVPGQPGLPQAGAPTSPTGQVFTRETVLATGPRIAIETPLMKGSIALKGARIDDIALNRYRETVDPKSPAIVLLSTSGNFAVVPAPRTQPNSA